MHVDIVSLYACSCIYVHIHTVYLCGCFYLEISEAPKID